MVCCPGWGIRKGTVWIAIFKANDSFCAGGLIEAIELEITIDQHAEGGAELVEGCGGDALVVDGLDEIERFFRHALARLEHLQMGAFRTEGGDLLTPAAEGAGGPAGLRRRSLQIACAGIEDIERAQFFFVGTQAAHKSSCHM